MKETSYYELKMYTIRLLLFGKQQPIYMEPISLMSMVRLFFQ